jgi:CPA2 family monovalent cation:H+ antiporter-2
MLMIITATLFVAIVLNVILNKIHLPTIIGYILTGTIIAYGFDLHAAVHNHELKEIAEFGVVFLMFTIGLEFSVHQLKRMKYEVFVTGSLQIIITAAMVYLISAFIFGVEQKISFIIALVIALSSTAIVLKTFNENGKINRRFGQRALGILIMQDIAVIPILLLIGFMANTDKQITTILFDMIVGAAILLLTMWIIGKYFLDPFFKEITKTRSEELFVATILFLAIGASYFAHALGFSYSLGAFIAGMLIAETHYKHQAEADLIPFRDLLLGIFFITVGMQIDFEIIFSYMHTIMMLLVGVMVLKFVIIYFLVQMTENKKTSIKTALSLVQIGEFSLALLELARTNDLIGAPYGQVLIVTIVLSMIITPIILKNLAFIADKLAKEDEDSIEPFVSPGNLTQHTVILGFGEFGQSVAKVLSAQNVPYVAIESNIATVKLLRQKGEHVIFGDALKHQIVKKAEISQAKKVIVAIDNAEKLYQVCEMLSRYVDREKILVKVHSSDEKAIIDDLGISHVVVENQIMSDHIVKQV